MLLAAERGLDTCPQEYWSVHHATVSAFCETPPELMLFCGLAFGSADPEHPVNTLSAGRASSAEWLVIKDH